MKKQLIVVVHGVGVRSAGLCADQLSAVLNEAAEPQRLAGSGAALQGWRPHSSDDFHLHEAAQFGRRGLLPTFAAHLRRFRRYDPKQPDKITHERVVADYYWGDISGTGGGGLQVLVGLVKIILGLSHAVRENAMDVFPGLAPRAIWMRRIARAAPLLIHGPIAALNIVLLAGLFLAAGLGYLASGAAGPGLGAVFGALPAELVLGGLTIAAGWPALRLAQVYLLRHLCSWVIAVGALVLLLAGLDWLGAGNRLGGMMAALDGFLKQRACAGVAAGDNCNASYAGISILGLRLMGVMMLCWALCLIAAVVVGFGCQLRKAFPERARVSAILQPAIALMTLLWFVFMAAVWATVMKLLPGLVAFPDQVMSALRLVTPAAVALLLIVVVGLGLHLRKARALAKLPPPQYLPQRDSLAERHRLIVGWWLLAVLTLFTAVIVATGVLSTLGICPVGADAQCAALTSRLADWVPGVMTLIALAAALLVGVGRSPLAMGVAIVTDVLVYLNDYSWRSREAALGTSDAPRDAPTQTRTLLERGLALRQTPPPTRQGYWLRHRIHARMQALMATLIRDETPDEIVIVAHSQGTMIALDVIEMAGQGWLQALHGKAELKLVTMGSPYIHVYNTYFPSLFHGLAERPMLHATARGGLLSAWVNIFRVDDFVGTHIDTRRDDGAADSGCGWPLEVPVPPNGHTNYWVDRAVFPALLQILGFKA